MPEHFARVGPCIIHFGIRTQGDRNAGDERAVIARLRRYRDAGVTDLAARIVPLGADPAARMASRMRTQAFLAGIGGEF